MLFVHLILFVSRFVGITRSTWRNFLKMLRFFLLLSGNDGSTDQVNLTLEPKTECINNLKFKNIYMLHLQC
jgi:hypothetical protein